jgi:hypothetical protein
MKGTGIQIGSDYDILVENGSTRIGDVQPQNQALIVVSNPGEWKQHPEMGVGIESWVLDDNPGNLRAEVKRHLKSDDFKVDRVTLENGELRIGAKY